MHDLFKVKHKSLFQKRIKFLKIVFHIFLYRYLSLFFSIFIVFIFRLTTKNV